MRKLLAICLLSITLTGACLTIDDTDIGISKMIPTPGDRIALKVPLLNETDTPWEGSVRLSLRVGCREEPLGEATVVERQVKLEPGKAEDFEFAWTPERNGFHRLVFELAEPDVRVERQVAVTNRDLYFVWFGTPKEFRWCNVPTTVKTEDEAWWLRRGAIPCHWKCGVCCKDQSLDRFVANWGAADWIAIDEVGGPGEVTDKFIAAWKRLRQEKPDQFTAVWFMGAHHYWADIKDLVDLFVPEIYLNYRGNHLGQFDSYLKVAREAGVIDQVIPGLGINQIEDEKTKRVTVSPTKEDVLRQVRHLKRTAPELNGIGFFTASGAWGVAEYADQLCGDYYVKPVLTLQAPDSPLAVSAALPAGAVCSGAGAAPVGDGQARWACVRVGNVGGMDADRAVIQWAVSLPGGGRRLTEEALTDWGAGEERVVACNVTGAVGALGVTILASDDHTILDGRAETYLADPAWELPVVVAPGRPAPVPLPGFRAVDGDGPYALRLPPDGQEQPAAILPARPGLEERLAAYPLPTARPDDYRAGLIAPAVGPAAPAPAHSREGDLLTVTNRFYRAALDLSSDALTTLRVGEGENLLRSPWQLGAGGHEGFGQARVEALPGCLVVTIPYDSAQASGESQYLFFDYSPAIRVARSWVPKGEVTLKGAGDRCSLFQRGGTFALQPGVGGPVRRGRLHDGSAYRDLLFGYLGTAPEPENADKAGWIDFSYSGEDGGFGVAIEYRWQDSDTQSYDVTRLYDASDWLEVLYLWGTEKTFTRPQRSCVWLVPHGPLDLTDEAVRAPAQALWEQWHGRGG